MAHDILDTFARHAGLVHDITDTDLAQLGHFVLFRLIKKGSV